MPMPHPAQPNPDPDFDGWWPSCDVEQPGVSIRPLSHADLQVLLAHLDRHDRGERRLTEPAWRWPAAGEPVVTARVRASVGRPGASAQAEYRRRRASELAAWSRGLPWRGAAVLAAGAVAGMLATELEPHLTALAVGGLGWQLRFRPSADSRAWRRGVKGERRAARLLAPLERHGWAVLHDLAIPGSQANIDHLAIGPGGVLLVDSKQYRGRLRLDGYGMLWHGRHLLVSGLRKIRWAADQADEVLGIADVDVTAIVAVHGVSVPWGQVRADGVTVVPARRVPDLLQAFPPLFGPERVAWLVDRARARSRSAA